MSFFLNKVINVHFKKPVNVNIFAVGIWRSEVGKRRNVWRCVACVNILYFLVYPLNSSLKELK